MRIQYTTVIESPLLDKNPLGWLTQDRYLGKLLIIGDVYDVGTIISGRLILAHKATPTIYGVTDAALEDSALVYKAQVHDIKIRLAPYGVIYKSKDIIIQARDYQQKVFDVYPYKSGWLLK